jgi:hypothetical protein
MIPGFMDTGFLYAWKPRKIMNIQATLTAIAAAAPKGAYHIKVWTPFVIIHLTNVEPGDFRAVTTEDRLTHHQYYGLPESTVSSVERVDYLVSGWRFEETADTSAPACSYQAWTGRPLPVSREELWEEYERLSGPTSEEFAADKSAAAAACHTAAMNAIDPTSATPNTHTMTHCVLGRDGHDIGLFDSVEIAFAWAQEGETVVPLDTPVVRDDCRRVSGPSGWGVW